MELLETVGLADKADAYTRSLSGGMRRRLMVAKAMVHNPPILVLDEPTAGVDIELRKQLWDNVRALNERVDRPFKDIPQALSGVCAHVQKEGRRTLMLRYSPDEVDLGAVLTIIQKAKLGIADITTDDSDLEDVFLQLTSSK